MLTLTQNKRIIKHSASRYDPTHTTLLRKLLVNKLHARMRALAVAIDKFLVEDDELGLMPRDKVITLAAKDELGYWFTTDTGAHVFVKEGQSKEDAIKERFENPKTLDEAEIILRSKLNNEPIEYLYAFDKNNKFIFSQKGNEKKVDVPSDDIIKFVGGKLAHSHPTDVTFSNADIDLIKRWSLTETRVISKNTTYVLTKPTSWKGSFKEWANEVNKLPQGKNVSRLQRDAIVRAFAKKYGMSYTVTKHAITNVQTFAFATNAQKLEGFNKWLKQQINKGLLTVDSNGDPWTAQYIKSAYKKGLERAYTDANKKQINKDDIFDFYTGSREQFLRSTFFSPETTDKIKIIYARNYEDLTGIGQVTSQRLSNILATGLVNGEHPYKIAKTMTEQLSNIDRTRARMIARTEIIHAHAEGQLNAFESLGVEEVGIQAEWSTAGDNRVCEFCNSHEGKVYKVSEAHDLIPAHPNCRCTWLPITGVN